MHLNLQAHQPQALQSSRLYIVLSKLVTLGRMGQLKSLQQKLGNARKVNFDLQTHFTLQDVIFPHSSQSTLSAGPQCHNT